MGTKKVGNEELLREVKLGGRRTRTDAACRGAKEAC